MASAALDLAGVAAGRFGRAFGNLVFIKSGTTPAAGGPFLIEEAGGKVNRFFAGNSVSTQLGGPHHSPPLTASIHEEIRARRSRNFPVALQRQFPPIDTQSFFNLPPPPLRTNSRP